jgi:hypothetical protein
VTALPKKKIQIQNTMARGKQSPNKKTTGRRHGQARADPDAVTDTLKDISDELGATGGSPPAPSTPTDQGASASNDHDDDVTALGSDGAGAGLYGLAQDAKAALLERRIEKRTKELAKLAKLKQKQKRWRRKFKKVAELEKKAGEAMVIHIFFLFEFKLIL